MTVKFFLLAFCLALMLALLFWQHWTQSKRFSEQQRQSELLDGCFYGNPLPTTVTSVESGKFLLVNNVFETEFGWSNSFVAGKTLKEIGLWHEHFKRDEYVQKIKERGWLKMFPMELQNARGQLYYANVNASLFSYQGEAAIISVITDRAVFRQMEESILAKSRRFQVLFENIRQGIARVDRYGYFVECNRMFCEELGYSMEELQRLRPENITPPQWHERDEQIWREETLARGWSDSHEKEQIKKDGTVYPVEVQFYTYADAQGRYDGYWGFVQDISGRKHEEETLHSLAYCDQLTGLPNRILFQDRITHAIGRAQRGSYSIALLYIDLDRFKNINDTLGIQMGNALLKVVAEQLGKLLRSGDSLARMGGDEFSILLEEQVTPQGVSIIAERIVAFFEHPIVVMDQEIYITASIGISLYPEDSDTAEALLSQADLAMFKAKELGRNTWQFFEKSIRQNVSERLQLENSLRHALQRHELDVYYQPQIDIVNDKLVGVEALVRWNHPEFGLLLPDRFIPLAEDMGIITSVGAWVIQEACRQLAQWRAAGFLVPRMVVNLSAQQLERASLVELVARQLEINSLEPGMLELEITESMLMRQSGRIMEVLHSLRDLGVSLAIDDFGTGYSSLGYLKRLPVRHLKVDSSFVRDIGKDSGDEAIIRAIIAMSNSLGLEVVAEGVEHAEQSSFLRAEGCRYAQGFFYAHPTPANTLLSGWKDREQKKEV
jgi:diguanylate cyclase (GGDEF)-like protein/PAS domain S-box-containing protein